MEQKSSVLLGCATWTCDCSAAHLLVTVSHGTTYSMPCTRAALSSSLPQTGIGGSTTLPSQAAGQHYSSGSEPSCVASSAVLMWPEGAQLVAAGQLWYLVISSFLVFPLIPILSLLCVAPSSLSPSASHFVGAFVSLSSFHLSSSILALIPACLPGPSGAVEPRPQHRLIGVARGKSWLALRQLPSLFVCVFSCRSVLGL